MHSGLLFEDYHVVTSPGTRALSQILIKTHSMSVRAICGQAFQLLSRDLGYVIGCLAEREIDSGHIPRAVLGTLGSKQTASGVSRVESLPNFI